MAHKHRLIAIPSLVGIGMLITSTAGWSSTADHTKFEILKQDFKSGPEVTKACLTCHTNASDQIMHTFHWTWKSPTNKKIGKGAMSVNNFCISTQSNEPRCTSCHVGYGWKDKTFDHKDPTKVDCLVCHDTTGKYKKFPAGAGHPLYAPKKFKGKPFPVPNLSQVAQHVGPTSNKTCGSCHYYGGGGEFVKHADLASALNDPPRELDVHMSKKGAGFTCESCHRSKDHKIAGRFYDSPATKVHKMDYHNYDKTGHVSHVYCESCHGNAPHKSKKLNDHVAKVACQTCHIPKAPRGDKLKTKTWWDWSKAGKRKPNGKPLVKRDAKGDMTYHSFKGEFKWGYNMTPEYVWYNGAMKTVQFGDKIDDTKQPIALWHPEGSYGDPNARIYPMKVMRSKQPYDPVNKTMVAPHLFGSKASHAYWKEFDWNKSIDAGMKYAGLKYSGKYDFLRTDTYWPITHMVAPKEQAVTCNECHVRKTGRLEKLKGFYLPGRDNLGLLDTIGWALAGLSLLGVIGHGSLRVVLKPKGQNGPAPKPGEKNESSEASTTTKKEDEE